MNWRDRFSAYRETLKEETRFSRQQLIVVAGLSVLTLIGGLLTARAGRLHAVRSEPSPQTTAKPAARRAPRIEKRLVVHVSGAVAKPGVYRLRSGSRVADAVAVAGGAATEADLDVINLAAFVHDGQKIHVNAKGAVPAGTTAEDMPAGGEVSLVNLNTATAEQLDGLDGIGPVLSKRILEWRRRHGRFTNVRQLDEVEGIGPKKLGLIKDQVTVD